MKPKVTLPGWKQRTFLLNTPYLATGKSSSSDSPQMARAWPHVSYADPELVSPASRVLHYFLLPLYYGPLRDQTNMTKGPKRGQPNAIIMQISRGGDFIPSVPRCVC